MNAKNLVIASLVGGIVYFMLGGLAYGMLFTNFYPAEGSQNMVLTFLGCLSVTLLMAYIFLQWAGISDPMSGAKAGGIIGLLFGASMNFFMYSSKVPNYGNMVTDIILNTVMGAVAGAVIAFVISKLK